MRPLKLEYCGKIDKRKIYAGVLDPNKPFSSPKEMTKRHALLIYVDKKDFEKSKLRNRVKELIENHAHYIVCAGEAAAELHDLFDEVFIYDFQEKFPYEDPDNKDNLSTSWHPDNFTEAVFEVLHLAYPNCGEYQSVVFLEVGRPNHLPEFKKYIEDPELLND